MAPDSDSPRHAPSARRALAGFCLSGLLASLLGAILPAWGYHLKTEFLTVGGYFLCMMIGVVLSVEITRRLLPRKGVSYALVLASGLASGALLILAFSPPPIAAGWRMAGLLLLGLAFGLLNSAIFHAISPIYRRNPAATVNMGGIVFGLGCLLVTVVVAASLNSWTVTIILSLIAAFPAIFGVLYSRTRFPQIPIPPQPTIKQTLVDFKNRGAVLPALLLFFQFGNEWSIAGWLPIFLIHRLGISPEASLWLLALYWLFLLTGRVGAMAILPRVSHARLLIGSAAAAMFGCILLLATNNRFGAVAGILMAGSGFAAIYPLVAEKIGHRFSYYYPGFFNGIFSFAMIGAMLAPSILGYMAHAWGVGMVMALPLLGTSMVFLLIPLIWLESKIGG